MDRITADLSNIIKNLFENYGTEIMKKYDNITSEDLERIWDKLPDNLNIKLVIEKKSEQFSNCCYVFTKGNKNGQLCNARTKNGKYCSRHSTVRIPILKDNQQDDPKKIVISLNKNIGKYCHKETGMVFKSLDEKVVIGHLSKNSIEDLTENHIEICKQWGFAI